MYRAVTEGIEVEVESFYLEEESEPDDHYYVWAYRVRIANGGKEPVILRMRHWTITDANGRCREVKGPGVVGKQPCITPGDVFEYTSGAPLPTPSGMMWGRYRMERSDGTTFDVSIPAFSLDHPDDPSLTH